MAGLSLTVLFPLFVIIFILASEASAQPISVKYFCNEEHDRGNYTANCTYHTNLNILLSTLTSNTEINYGFYNLSYGENTDKVYAIGLCRGDIKADKCLSCLNNARVNLTQLCPNQKEAIGWYEDETCMLRYSDRLIFGLNEIGPAYYVWNTKNATENANQFNKDVRNLLESLTRRSAASGDDSHRKYATETALGPINQTIYGLVQCTPDLSGSDCSGCLHESISTIPSCCNNSIGIGARIVRPSCILRYETGFEFYDPKVDAAAPPPLAISNTSSQVGAAAHLPPALTATSNTSSQGKSHTSHTAIGVPVLVVVVVVLSIIFIYLRGRKPRRSFRTQADDNDDDGDEITIAESLQFNFDTIRDATDNFSDFNKLGRGGFGAVYKGKLSNEQEIAVKRLSTNSSQGDIEFKNEVLLVAKLQHRNLVRLLGFCLEGRERLLIYEFIRNKSLDYFIFDPARRAQLNWESRYKIIGGIARGILYLHEDSRLRIIHRDLKASNILLDEEMNPKIADFGMARLLVVNQTHEDTNRIVGTYGYMAPEYARYGQFSVKSDVFSFGVLVLEIVSGRKSYNLKNSTHGGESTEDLLSFAWRNWNAETATNIVDPTLINDSESEIMRCINIALLCVQENVTSRPTMGAIVLMLNSYSVSVPAPSDSQFWEYHLGTTRSAPESINKASITDLYPR